MKNILVLSGGTGTAWSICNALRSHKDAEINLLVCDTNPAWLVHSSVLADVFLQVPPIKAAGYYEHMLSLVDQYHIDIIVPLIDLDFQYFPRDNEDLLARGVFSTAPERKTFELLSNKKWMADTLQKLGVATPRTFERSELDDDTDYFVKPVLGFGARNTQKLSGREIKRGSFDECIFQELCLPREVTVDVFSAELPIRSVCRERIETKAGVCTKARVYREPKLETALQAVAQNLALPECCCVQFMESQSGEWKLTDFNLRLGAGSALSAAVGFKLAEAASACWLGLSYDGLLKYPDAEKFVVRHYTELVTK